MLGVLLDEKEHKQGTTHPEKNKPPAAQAEGSWKGQRKFPLPLYLVLVNLNQEFCVQLCLCSTRHSSVCSVEGHRDGQEHKDLVAGHREDKDSS